ncbi:MAG: 4-hydroxy-tetrahydrodipicolinate reductase [Desulfarculales bacterium]|jgi:4-hydroxy-tetrahydrodipicolinate reductase|nr:4-hydroxy-tetrahydrodipicolinate reductase [Desulfarculales bacterium]
MTDFAIAGIGGRMGRALAGLIASHPYDYTLKAGFEYPAHPDLGRELALFLGESSLPGRLAAMESSALRGAEVLMEFTAPAASLEHLALAVRTGTPVVLGTTGFSEEEEEKVKAFARQIPLLFTSNTSLGMNLMISLAGRIATLLGSDYALEVIEAHHDQKKDAPSGSARKLLNALAQARGLDPDKVCRHGRLGLTGPRGRDEIGVSVIRGGDIVGEHTVMFIGPGERLELTHRVQSRATFAAGALRAGVWLKDKEPGLYDMQDVLHLK